MPECSSTFRVPAASACVLCLVALMASGSAGPVTAQEVVRVEALRLDPDAHVNEVRTLVGVVERLVGRDGGGEPAFYLEDDFGHQIVVVPFAETPGRGTRVRVTGIVTLDLGGDPVITVVQDGGIEPATLGSPAVEEAPVAGARQDELRDTNGSRSRLVPMLALAAVLAAAGALTVVRLRARRRETNEDEPEFPIADLWPPPGNHFEGRTMRFLRPDSRIKLMPARLEVIRGGDTGEEIRFVGVEDEPISMMFGRAEGEGPFHVQLKQQTVSRTHAVVRFRHGEWLLENLSMTNPTILNGEVLGAKERLLTEGDKIEMGEVAFMFRES